MFELTTALNCLDTTGQCTHITIPSTATIAFCDTIAIGNDHAGLHLTINGTLLWVGPAVSESGLVPSLIRVNGVLIGPITIDGTGSIVSIHEPCRNFDEQNEVCIEPNSSAKVHIGYGVRIVNSNNITVKGTSETNPLRFQKLSDAIKVESDTSSVLTLQDLKIEGMTGYGVFIGAGADDAKVNGVTVRRCHVQGAYDQHGFRIYANNVTIEDCSACRQRASGLWIVQGKNIIVDGFQADEYLRIGPNHECNGGGGPEKGERLMNANVRDVNVDYVEVQSGVIGCWLDDITMQTATGNGLRISYSYSPEGNIVARPTNRVHWGLLQGNTGFGIAGQTYPSGCNGPKINSCPADIDVDTVVDIDDLLEVISNWGTCPTAVGACWFDNICHPHWTASACATAGGEYKGNGTDCWTHPASAPCCTLDQSWTCAENIPPFACWASNKKYLANEPDCIGVNCATAVSTMPPCNAGCRFPQFPCTSDIAPIAFGNSAVDIDDLLLVIQNWGPCAAPPEAFPNGIMDCFNIYCDGLSGEEWEECLEKCFEAYCTRFPDDC